MTNKYGMAALSATFAIQKTKTIPPNLAWMKAVKEIFPHSLSSQEKACPKAAYLGLCEEGLIKGVKKGKYTRSTKNKNYAIMAVNILQENPKLENPQELWEIVMNNQNKLHNNQMDVVLALHKQNLLNISHS